MHLHCALLFDKQFALNKKCEDKLATFAAAGLARGHTTPARPACVQHLRLDAAENANMLADAGLKRLLVLANFHTLVCLHKPQEPPDCPLYLGERVGRGQAQTHRPLCPFRKLCARPEVLKNMCKDLPTLLTETRKHLVR